MKSVQKILIPADCSLFSLALTSFMTTMPMFAEAELLILYVINDPVVIATHGRAGLAHMLFGSVAEKVVRSSRVPVLTIKPEEVLAAMTGRTESEEKRETAA